MRLKFVGNNGILIYGRVYYVTISTRADTLWVRCGKDSFFYASLGALRADWVDAPAEQGRAYDQW